MRKFGLIIICVITIVHVACNKTATTQTNGCTNALPSSDSAALLKFAGDSIDAVKDTTGLYYQIIDSGTGVHPTASSYLEVTYFGKLMNNTTFTSDSNSNLGNATLGSLIIGWQIGLQKIGKGGHIKLLIPSAYAWGCTGYQNISPNQPVYFDIWLLNVQ